jgi:Nucleotidyl transferase AbiEii toxin, Type IV TA system
LATEPGAHHSDYDASQTHEVLAEAAFLLRNLGFAAEHTVLIGGLVPTLLVLDPRPSQQPHVGTTDLDLCLSVALVEGDTAEYERIEKALANAGYRPTEHTFRWRRERGLRLRVEFFCPAGDDRPVGVLFRPRHATNPVAKHNMGAKLSAIALDAGGIIGEDVVVVVEREVVLPEGAGRTTARFRVTGLVGFLVSKLGALVGRKKPKDAYDIVWLLENWAGGPVGAAADALANACYDRDEVTVALVRLAEEFAAIDGLGASSCVRFRAERPTSSDDRQRLARQAVGAVKSFTEALHNGSRAG